MNLRVMEYENTHLYNRLMILTGTELTSKAIANFEADCKHIGINYMVIGPEEQGLIDGIMVDDTQRYYAMSKGEVVGMETGHRTGDALRIMTNFGRRPERGGVL